MSHQCHYGPCKRRTKPKHAFCAHHWRKLSKPVQDAIWKHYTPGQEQDTSKVSLLWLAAMRDAQAELLDRDGKPDAAAHSRARAERYRRRAS